MAVVKLAAVTETRPRVRLTCWGDFALANAQTGEDLKPRGRKARALLAYLARHPGKPISRERLAGLLWGDRPEEQARASLRQAIAELKPLANGGRNALQVERDHLRLDPEALETDLGQIEAAAARSDRSALLALLPDRDERLFANLDDIDDGFDDWLAGERSRQRDALDAMLTNVMQTRGGPNLQVQEPPAQPTSADEREAPGPRIATSRSRLIWAALIGLIALALIVALSTSRFVAEQPPSSVAVLSFKDLSGGQETHFAEGFSEEILGQLARNGRLKVLGRTSAWAYKDQALDAPALGRKLGVDYLVEGSLRAAAGQVRVDVALVRAEDGARLWSDRLDGSLRNLFEMQDRIGAAVSTRLAGGSAPAPRPTPRVARAEAYSLTLTARGLMRTRKPHDLTTAVTLLRQAVRIDPSFAAAWAQLGGATIMRIPSTGIAPGARVAQARQAETYVRHALKLEPGLADGHAMLGMVLGFETPEARAHLKRAAQLDPNDTQKLFWLSHALANEGDFVGQLKTLRRAVAIDPTWHRTANAAGAAAWEMGHRDEARRYIARLPREDQFIACQIDYSMGLITGDYSQIAKTAAAARIALADAEYPRRNLGFVALTTGQLQAARALLGMPDAEWRLVAAGALPDAAALAALNRTAESEPGKEELLLLAVRGWLNAGRGAEVARLGDDSEGALGSLESKSAIRLLLAGPEMALALRQAGRNAEAERLLARVEHVISRSRDQERTPNWVHAAAAQVAALQGRPDEALTSLERAVALGWHHVSWGPSPDIADLPAFRSLRGEARFERVRARLRADFERERRETGPIAV